MALLNKLPLAMLALGFLSLSGCSDDNDEPTVMVPEPAPVTLTYDITVTNLTQAQPLSPLAVGLHEDISMWQIGESVSEAFELLAEEGDNAEFLANSEFLATASGADILPPGETETVTVSITDGDAFFLTVATMLVNTNDAFAGVTQHPLSGMEVNQSVTLFANIYDAGTEANTEMAGTIPGPSDGGEGFNADRDDANAVSIHPGVVTGQDSLPNSVLSAIHRFNNPGLKIIVTRVE
ncbi:spondin domain-containing protein [Alteromonas facilis]|uniref:spondin domain-containing protein n=1 Tax=Alteromonas facilis TaxID=2048004 RepID=UPI000C289EE8|nr:spondin domain-containing protein [Alteromonas facilis]